MSNVQFLTSLRYNFAMLKLLLCCLCLLISGLYAFNHGEALKEFEAWMDKFNKTYATAAQTNTANYYFNYHRNLINQQNALNDRNASSYRVQANQFSDIRLVTFAARLPQAVYPTSDFSTKTPVLPEEVAPVAYDMLEEFDIGVTQQDQGTVCSSSWAYAAAKSLEILNAIQALDMNSMNYSAQALIDCAGMGTGCSTQVPQTAFEYLTQVNGASLVTEMDYVPDKTATQQRMCIPTVPETSISLDSYGKIPDNDDKLLMRYVASGIPVIVEHNPATFGFMHYHSGVYVPPTRAQASSSQFLVIVGYGRDARSNLNYWRALNSFGFEWGEEGFIKIVRSATQPIAKRAVFPNSLGNPPIVARK